MEFNRLHNSVFGGHRRGIITSVAIGCALALLMASAVGTIILSRVTSDTQNLVSETLLVNVAAAKLLGQLLDAEAGQRGFLLSGDATFFQQYTIATASIAELESKLHSVFSNDIEQQQRLEIIGTLTRRKLDELAHLIDLARSNRQSEAVSLMLGNTGKQLMDELRLQIAAFQNSQSQLLGRRQSNLADAQNTGLAAILCSFLVALIIGGVGAVRRHRETASLLNVSEDLTAANRDLDRRVEERASQARENAARFRGTFENAAVGMANVGLNGKLLRVNQHFCDLVGYNAAELLGMQFQELTHPDDLAVELEQTRKMLSGAVAHFMVDKRYIRKNGAAVWIGLAVSLERTQFGEPDYYIAVVRDISHQKALAARLQDIQMRERVQHRKLVAVLNAIPVAVFLASDASGKYSISNRAARSMLRIADTPSGEEVFAADAHRHYEVLSNGRVIQPTELPIARAAATGQPVTNAELRIAFNDGVLMDVTGNALPIFNDAGENVGAVAAFVDVTASKHTEAHQRFLMRELTHRSNNLLAIIQAMAGQTAKSSSTIAEFRVRFGQRLQALATSHKLLVEQNWLGVSVRELVRVQLSSFADVEDARIEITGPDLTLTAAAAESLGLAFHELANNAVKYGALSVPSGRLKLSWSVDGCDTPERQFHMSWIEASGPAVQPPIRRGFGNIVVERMVATSLGATVRLEFPTEGVTWQLDAPATCLADFVAARPSDTTAAHNKPYLVSLGRNAR